MSESQEQLPGPWSALGAEPGCCAACEYAKVNVTRRGTAYLRCLRAAWDERLSRYPALPVGACPGFAPSEPSNPR